MKIAIVRGSSLNKWEMQNYEPLAERHKILTVASHNAHHDISEIRLPICQVYCLGDILSFVPFGIALSYKTLGDPQYLSDFEKRIAGYDLVHTAEIGNYYSLQSIRAKEKGLVKKVIVTVWENIPFLGNDNPKRKANKGEVIKKADFFLAVTTSSQKALLKEGVPLKKIEVVSMGVDLTRFFPRRKKKTMRDDKKIILFVGRLVKEKGIYDLIEAAKALKRRGDWELLMVGDGPEKDNLLSSIHKFDLEARISISPNIPYSRMPKIYRQGDILVLPSINTKNWQEQYGMVLVEAMASAVPVITTYGTQSEVLGPVALVVPQKNPSFLSHAIFRLLNDDKQREKRGSLARKRAERLFDAKKVSEKIEGIYKQVLGI